MRFYLIQLIFLSFATTLCIAEERFNTVNTGDHAIQFPPEKMMITEFMPLSITAGTNSILTIKGSGFGKIKGNGGVYFKNSDDGGATYILFSDPEDYIIWSDVEIQLKLPSFIINDPEHRTPGSGIFMVRNDTGIEAYSKIPLGIKYAINSNHIDSLFRKKGTLYLSSNSSDERIKNKVK